MNTLNFINIIKMTNVMVDFKRFLQLLWPENQLYEINSMINKFNKSNRKGENVKKISHIKWTKDIKKTNNN